MKDYVIRAIANNENIRAFAVNTTCLVERARLIHKASPVAIAALGRTLTAGSLMSVMLKGEKDTLTIQIKGNGPLGGVVAIADSKCNVRGYVYNPDVQLPLTENYKLDVGGAMGKGYLNVIKDIGLKEPYTGQVPLVSGEIGEDLAYYFLKSEQINSAVGLGVLVERDYSISIAGGFIIQVMPDISEDTVDKLENSINKINSVTNLFKEYNTPEEVLKHILKDFNITIVDKVPTQYLCTCSKQRVEKALISIGKEELNALIEEQGEAELSCHFCDKIYNFDKKDLQRLYNESTN